MPSSRAASSAPRQRRRAEPPPPLGSLTQADAVTASCSSCGAGRVTRLAMTLTDGTPAVFTSCTRCEHRGWEADGAVLSIDDVVDRTRRP
ncbi:hypothetical protein WDZ16_03915 [Pseudokineococcus marinus]|uniref:TFIIS-type domain-containing protein n=1 Tax=Pseudokineococcus marinus TaxID=351215 RepID=A0A849BY71_9ACTN|nr:hypothetical protein [Pseudokineococcus marinus]NNH24366.1 hypothetical protein [Pseudokineococcus marinus]